MFGFVQIAEPEREVLEPQAPAAYVALAQKLGTHYSNDSFALRESLRALGLSPFRMDDVLRFLDRKYGSRGRWEWAGARSIDVRSSVSGWSDDVRAWFGADIYTKPIPMAVLETMDRLSQIFPAVRFFVSDERETRPIADPFLLAIYGREHYVIERWDEPGFTGQRL